MSGSEISNFAQWVLKTASERKDVQFFLLGLWGGHPACLIRQAGCPPHSESWVLKIKLHITYSFISPQALLHRKKAKIELFCQYI